MFASAYKKVWRQAVVEAQFAELSRKDTWGPRFEKIYNEWIFTINCWKDEM